VNSFYKYVQFIALNDLVARKLISYFLDWKCRGEYCFENILVL